MCSVHLRRPGGHVWAMPLPERGRGRASLWGCGCEGAASCLPPALTWLWGFSLSSTPSNTADVWFQGLSRKEEGLGTRWQHYYVLKYRGWAWAETLGLMLRLERGFLHCFCIRWKPGIWHRGGVGCFYFCSPHLSTYVAYCRISLSSLNNSLDTDLVSLWQRGINFMLQRTFQVLALTSRCTRAQVLSDCSCLVCCCCFLSLNTKPLPGSEPLALN